NEGQHVGKSVGARLPRARGDVSPEEENNSLRGAEECCHDGDVDQQSGDTSAACQRQDRRGDDEEARNEGPRKTRTPEAPAGPFFPRSEGNRDSGEQTGYDEASNADTDRSGEVGR